MKKQVYTLATKAICIFMLLSFVMTETKAQYLYDYQKIVDLDQTNQHNSTLTQTDDGGYFVVSQPTSANNDARLMCYKFDASLNVMWTSPLEFASGQTAAISASDVKQCSDGGYIICGGLVMEGSYGGGYLLKLDPAGNQQWFKRYTDNIVQGLNSVIETPKGYIAVGSAVQFSYLSDGIILSTDFAGETVWSQRVKGTKTVNGYIGSTGLYQVIPIDDTHFATVGSTNMFADMSNQYESDAVVVTFDISGGISGNWVYGNQFKFSTAWESGNAIRYSAKTKSLIVLGEAEEGSLSTCHYQLYNDIWLWNIDVNSGMVNWNNRYNIINNSGSAYADLRPFPSDLELDQDNGDIILTGSFNIDPIAANVNRDAFICRLDQTGHMYDHRRYADNTNNELFKIRRTDHQSCVAAGFTDQGFDAELWLIESYDNIKEQCNMTWEKFVQSPWKVNIIKADIQKESPLSYDLNIDPTALNYKEYDICDRIALKSGYKTAKESNILAEREFNTWINSSKNIELTLPGNDEYSLILLDASGKMMGTYKVHQQDQISTQNLATGMYLIKCTSTNKNYTQKIWIP